MPKQEKCPICKYSLLYMEERPNDFDGNVYVCEVCGNFKISRTAQSMLCSISNKDKKMAILCHNIRKQKNPIISSSTLEALEHQSLPNPSEQAANLILWLGKNTTSGEYKDLPYVTICSVSRMLLCGDHSLWLIQELFNRGLLYCKA
jgi:uncharacterized protein YbaR (Trm112 family)